MKSYNDEVFNLYKPLRNFIRKARLIDSLQAIYYHSIFQDFNEKLPPKIVNTPFGYSYSESYIDLFHYHLMPWELQILTKEVIMHGQLWGGKKNMLDWNYLADSVNKLKELENSISKIYSTTDNVLFELFRIPHRQFRLQRKPNHQMLAKYLMLYKNPDIYNIIERKIGMTVEEVFLLGYSMIGFFIKHFALLQPTNYAQIGISDEQFNTFLRYFSKDYLEIKDLLLRDHEYNEKFAYTVNSLNKYPLIRFTDNNRKYIVCPIPRLLFDRFSYGIYYEVCNEPNFDHAFGKAFQSLIGTMLHRVFNKTMIYEEQAYLEQNAEKMTTDWIVQGQNELIFVECKTKRITVGAKIALLDQSEITQELGKMADFIVQVYKQVIDYKKGLYPKIRYENNMKLYPLVVTLEDWYIWSDKIVNILEKQIKTKLAQNHISESVLEEYPYTICSFEDFELLIQLVSQVGIRAFFEKINSNSEYQLWQLHSILQKEFPQEMHNCESIFTEDYMRFIDDKLETIGKK